MRNLVALAGYVLLADGDPAHGRGAMSRTAAHICRARTMSSEDVLTYNEHVLFEGRFGVATVYEGTESSAKAPTDLVVDSSTAAIAIGEVWGSGTDNTSSSQSQVVISDAIRKYKATPDRLNGVYAAVVYDDAERTVRLYADRLGLQPLYYHRDPHVLLFSSTIQSLLEDDRIAREMSEEVLAQLLYLGFLAGDETYIPGIHRLPSGGIVTCSASKDSVRRYWDFAYRADTGRNTSLADYTDECYELLRAAARRMVDKPEKTGVLLSGGLDSRVTLGTLVHEFGPRFRTRTYGLAETADTRTAQQVASALSCPHETLTLRCDTLVQDLLNLLFASDFLVESRSAQIVEVMRLIRPTANHWFTGGLLNATFSSLWRDDRASATQPNCSFQELILSRGSSEERFQSIVGPRFSKMARESVLATCVRSNSSFAEASVADAFERFMISYRHRGFYIASHAYHRPGESRFLMCDYDLLDFFLRLPNELRHERRLYGHMLRTKWPELSHILYANTGAPVGEPPSRAYLRRKKRSRSIRRLARRLGLGRLLGPSPYLAADKAFTFAEDAEVRRLVESVLLSERALSRRHVDADGVRRLVSSLQGSASGLRLLFRLLRVELLIRCAVESDCTVFEQRELGWRGGAQLATGVAALQVRSARAAQYRGE